MRNRSLRKHQFEEEIFGEHVERGAKQDGLTLRFVENWMMVSK